MSTPKAQKDAKPGKATGKGATAKAAGGKAAPKGKKLPPKKPPGTPRKRSVPVAVEAAGMVALTPAEELFSTMVATGSSKVAALRSAYPEYGHWKADSQHVKACAVARNDRVAIRIQQLRTESAESNNADVQRLMAEVTAIVFADPRELVTRSYRCCRQCWGLGNLWQRTDEELRRDRVKHEDRRHARAMKDLSDPGEFDTEGGGGYDETAPPNPACPHCKGRGVLRTVTADLDNIGPEARALLAGVEEGRDGLKIKMHDKLAAANLLGRNLGAFEPETEVHVTVSPNFAEMDEFFAESLALAKAEEHAMKERARLMNQGNG